jgi:hypothetical protein
MYVVWADSPAAPLDPSFRAELAGLGVERLVVGLDDEEVAEAQLRLSTYDEPVTGVLSIWTDADPEPVTRALEGMVRELAGWQVEERRPLAPPRSADGARADALVNVALLRRPEEMEEAAWRHRWLDHHTPVAIRTQSTFGYVQNLVQRPLREGQRPVDALVEEFFPPAAATDLHAFYGSGGDDDELARRMTEMLASVATFGAEKDIDVVPTSRYEFALG